jgi:hypothetical protein
VPFNGCLELIALIEEARLEEQGASPALVSRPL